jgi:hypothetical protein
MSIRKRLTKILVGLGNNKALEKAHETTFSENKIEINLPGKKIGESDNGQLWITYENLGGFDFMNLIVVSRFNIKSKNRCEMQFLGGGEELTLVSDTEEIESDNSNPAKIWITQLSFDITKEQRKFIKSRVSKEIKIRYKKREVLFKMIK